VDYGLWYGRWCQHFGGIRCLHLQRGTCIDEQVYVQCPDIRVHVSLVALEFSSLALHPECMSIPSSV
jgi:hypothetical protein